MTRLQFTTTGLLMVLTSPAFAIVNGEIDYDERFPEIGAIVVVNPVPVPDFPAFADPPAVVCSGVLIHPRVMLTAGHCTADITALDAIDDVRVSFDVDSFDPKRGLESTQCSRIRTTTRTRAPTTSASCCSASPSER